MRRVDGWQTLERPPTDLDLASQHPDIWSPICGAGGRHEAYVCRLLPLTCLGPDIVEAILDGRQPKGLRLAEMLGSVALTWTEQQVSWHLGS
jgi:hypothetical protein